MTVLEVSKGRHVAYDVVGDPGGVPVFFQHGTGDSRLCKYPDDSVAAGLGVRLVTADRPGVGGCSAYNHRRVLDRVSDVEEIADALELDRFAVGGDSGGGPHALVVV